jgi:small subunit ribosomal protein S1
MNIENEENDELRGDEESFADLLERSLKKSDRLEPGSKIEGTILKITQEWIFIDTGMKGEGVIERKELLDADGNPTVKEGDRIKAFFLASRAGEMRFTTKIGGSAAQHQLEDVWRSGIPVEGFVEKEVKGGFEVKIAGTVRAFCPWSQIDLRRGEATAYVGKHLPFRIIEYGERGRNIVVSRRALLEEEENRRKEELKESLQVGATVKGTVASIRDFGAFVDIGGIQGLVPISEAAWGRVNDLREILSEGDEVEAVVKQIDWAKNRITLSIRDTLSDPWEKAAGLFPEGSFHTGKVARLAPFGAFITLSEGIDGLIHISKLGGGKRISHPREVVKEGEVLEVRVEGVDREARKLSLSPAGPAREAEEEARTMDDFRRKAGEKSSGMGTFGELLKGKLEKK